MGVVILVLVVIAALFVVVSGVWVALALITVSAHRDMPGLRRTQSSRTQCRTDKQSSDKS